VPPVGSYCADISRYTVNRTLNMQVRLLSTAVPTSVSAAPNVKLWS